LVGFDQAPTLLTKSIAYSSLQIHAKTLSVKTLLGSLPIEQFGNLQQFLSKS